jgi:5'-methylthioadenosine/S-adenosylhomocysteine nucleosidase
MWAIVSALPEEARELKEAIESPRESSWAGGTLVQGRFAGKDVVLATCGVGKALAAMTTQYLIHAFSPQALVFAGLAGALHSGLRQGDVILGAELLQHDLDATDFGFERGQIPFTSIRILNSDARLLSAALQVSAGGSRVVSGRILTGDRFIARRENDGLEYLTEELRGDAVEMEGAAVALVCSLHKVPFLIMRTISDSGDTTAKEDFNGFLHRASANLKGILSALLQQ